MKRKKNNTTTTTTTTITKNRIVQNLNIIFPTFFILIHTKLNHFELQIHHFRKKDIKEKQRTQTRIKKITYDNINFSNKITKSKEKKTQNIFHSYNAFTSTETFFTSSKLSSIQSNPDLNIFNRIDFPIKSTSAFLIRVFNNSITGFSSTKVEAFDD